MSNLGTLYLSNSNISATFNNIVYSGGAFVSQMKSGSKSYIWNMYSNCNFNSHSLTSTATSEGPVTGYARSGSWMNVTNVSLYGTMQITPVSVVGNGGSSTSG